MNMEQQLKEMMKMSEAVIPDGCRLKKLQLDCLMKEGFTREEAMEIVKFGSIGGK